MTIITWCETIPPARQGWNRAVVTCSMTHGEQRNMHNSDIPSSARLPEVIPSRPVSAHVCFMNADKTGDPRVNNNDYSSSKQSGQCCHVPSLPLALSLMGAHGRFLLLERNPEFRDHPFKMNKGEAGSSYHRKRWNYMLWAGSLKTSL